MAHSQHHIILRVAAVVDDREVFKKKDKDNKLTPEFTSFIIQTKTKVAQEYLELI